MTPEKQRQLLVQGMIHAILYLRKCVLRISWCYCSNCLVVDREQLLGRALQQLSVSSTNAQGFGYECFDALCYRWQVATADGAGGKWEKYKDRVSPVSANSGHFAVLLLVFCKRSCQHALAHLQFAIDSWQCPGV